MSPTAQSEIWRTLVWPAAQLILDNGPSGNDPSQGQIGCEEPLARPHTIAH